MTPKKIQIVEVGPRDGLQNEKEWVPTETKISLIEKLADAGLTKIEVTSFVSPKWVPQLKDAHEVFTGIKQISSVSYPVLTPNMKGFERALEADAQEIAVFGAASETFSQKNTNCSIEESINRFKPVLDEAQKINIPGRGYISCVLGGPYQGNVPVEDVANLADEVAEHLTGDSEVYKNPKQYFDQVITIDLDTLEPYLNGPFTPDKATPISKMKEEAVKNNWPTKVEVGLIGSCTNSSYEDISRASSIAQQAINKKLTS